MRRKHDHLRRAPMLAPMLALVASLAQAVTVGAAYAAPAFDALAVTAQREAPARLDLTRGYLINKNGNVMPDLKFDELEAAGFAVGDVVRLSYAGTSLELPVCEAYNEVPYGRPGVFRRAGTDGVVWVVLAKNGGDFASTHGVATKTVTGDGSVSWTPAPGIGDTTISFSIEMVERGGYEAVRKALDLTHTDVRTDYADLTDDEYANFRMITAGSIAPGVLFRSASPIDPRHNRNREADAAIRRAGVTHVIDLTNAEGDVAGLAGYPGSHYAEVSHLALAMSMDLTNDENGAKMAEAVRYIARNRGVFDVCCTEGKDRVGIACAVFECLMGATADEVVADYMVSYTNYYGVRPNDAGYALIADMNIRAELADLFGVDAIEGADLAALAEAYLKAHGLGDAELARAREHLSSAPKATMAAGVGTASSRRGRPVIHRLPSIA